jgi:uncharacterized protein
MIDSPYLPEEIVHLYPDAISKEYWDRCARHVLAFQRCASCGTFRHPPVPVCYVCRSTESEWAEVPGTGTVYSFTIVTHAVHPDLVDRLPFNVALVELPEAPGVRLVTNVVDAAPEDMAVGMRVRLHWDDLSTGASLPRFERA